MDLVRCVVIECFVFFFSDCIRFVSRDASEGVLVPGRIANSPTVFTARRERPLPDAVSRASPEIYNRK